MTTNTTFDELAEKQGKEWVNHLKDHKAAYELLQEDKKNLLKAMNCAEANLPDHMKDKLVREEENFKNDWGLYGRKGKALHYNQQKELDAYFKRQQEINLVKGQMKTPEKEKTR